MIFKSKIFRRFLIAYLPVTLAPLIIISCIALWYGRIEIRDQTFRQLEIMADGAEAQVLDYLHYLKIQTSGYGASKPIMDALKRRYRRTGSNHSDRVLNRYLAAGIKNFPECAEMFVLDVNGRVIASSDASNTGKDHSETDYFFNGRKAVYISNIFREEETGRITWLVSCPVRDVKGNKLLAVLVSRINPVTLSDITTERKVRALGAKSQALRIGKTGETYIVNRDNLMITESRFLDDVILQQAVDTEIVRCTRKAGETKAGNYPDYRGMPVDGASMVIWETLGWIIISEMDYKESVIPFQRLLHLSLAGICVLIPLIFFASWLLSRRFIRPIMRLVQADREIIQGDPSRAFISDREMPADELGEVMRIRNIMLASLKQHEKALRKQQEELQIIIDASPAWIFYKDKENRFIRVNKALADATGLPKEAIEGKTTFEIYPQYAEKYWENDKEVISSGQSITNIIEPVVLKDSTRWVQTDKIPYRDEKGHIIGIIGFALDITERKQAEEKLKQRLDDLEQFRKVTIQREIRMRELKDRVEALEKEIHRLKDTSDKPL